MNARQMTLNNRKNGSRTAGWNLTALAYRPGTTVRGWAILSLMCLTTTMANAELVMRIDGVETPSFSQVDFGDVLVGQSRQIVVTLRNEGTEEIVFLETPPIQLSGAFASEFSLIQPALEVGNKLSPNSSTAFAVRCEPTLEFANLNSNIFIFTSLSASPERLNLRAAGVAPGLAVDVDGETMVSGDEIAMGAVEEGDEAIATMTVRNTGTAALEILSLDLDAVGDFAQIGNLPNSIAPNGSASIDVRYTANGSDADFMTLTMITNDTSIDANGEFMLLFTASTIPAEEEEIVDPNEGNTDDTGETGGNDDTGNTGDDDDLNDDQNEQDISDDLLDDDDDLNEGDHEYVDDELNNDEELDQLEPIAPLGCGFGVGFCSLASMISIGAMKSRRRLNL